MTALSHRRPDSLGTKAREAVKPKPALRLVQEFRPWGHRAKATLKKGQKVFRAAGDLVILSMLERATLNGSQIAKEFEWTTGEVVPQSAIYPKLARLREQGRIEYYGGAIGGNMIKGIWMHPSSKPVVITDKGRLALGLFRGAMSAVARS